MFLARLWERIRELRTERLARELADRPLPHEFHWQTGLCIHCDEPAETAGRYCPARSAVNQEDNG